MARKRRGDRLKSEMNVVPYIDVMLVLLVIFMISAPLLNQSVEVALPSSSSDVAKDIKLDEEHRPIIISIDKEENYYIDRADDNTVPVTLSAMRDFVITAIANDNKLTVYIRADKDVEYQNVVKLIDILEQDSIPSVKLVMSE